jgi:MFS family permease
MKNQKKTTEISTSQRTILGVLVFINIFRNIGGGAIAIGFPDFISSIHGTASAFGLVIGIFSLASVVFQTPFAMLSDRIGRRRSILLSMGIYFLGTLLCAFARTVPQLVIFRAIQGIGAFAGILMAVITDAYEPHERSKIISYFIMALSAGYLLGCVMGGLLLQIMSPRGVFFVNSGMVGIVLGTIALFLPETRPKTISFDKTHHTVTFLKQKDYLFGVFLNMIKSFLLFGSFTYQLWLYRKEFQLPDIWVSLIIIPSTISYMAGNYFTSKLGQKLDSMTLIQYGSIGFMLSAGALLIFFNVGWFLLFSSFMYFFLGLMEPEITAFSQSFLPEQERGLGNGIFTTAGFLFRAFGEIILPGISDNHGYFGVYKVVFGLGCVLVCSIVLYRFIGKEKNKFPIKEKILVISRKWSNSIEKHLLMPKNKNPVIHHESTQDVWDQSLSSYVASYPLSDPEIIPKLKSETDRLASIANTYHQEIIE